MADTLNLAEIQAALREHGLDGWMFFDHHYRDPLAYRILGFQPEQTPTRRWYYFVPAEGEPTKVQHRIESQILSTLPGRELLYSSWREQRDQLSSTIRGRGNARIAMQYSPECAVPYVSMVDAGTVELLRALGADVVSSSDLVQRFEATWSPKQFELHLEAGRRVDQVLRAAFREISEAVLNNRSISEWDIKTFILSAFESQNLTTDHGPIVAVNKHASDPHYEPSPATSSAIRRGDVVLIDLWAKLREPRSVYYDITWTAFCGPTPPDDVREVFGIVAGARDAAIEKVQRSLANGETLCGCDVDDAARAYITDRGYGEYFIHRTGHSIGEDVHGAGANMDNLETHDERSVVAGTCFSIEPGVYLPAFGIRSEVNVYIDGSIARVTGDVQRDLLLLGT